MKLRDTLDSIEPADDRILAAFTDRQLSELGPLYGNNVQVRLLRTSLLLQLTGKSSWNSS